MLLTPHYVNMETVFVQRYRSLTFPNYVSATGGLLGRSNETLEIVSKVSQEKFVSGCRVKVVNHRDLNQKTLLGSLTGYNEVSISTTVHKKNSGRESVQRI